MEWFIIHQKLWNTSTVVTINVKKRKTLILYHHNKLEKVPISILVALGFSNNGIRTAWQAANQALSLVEMQCYSPLALLYVFSWKERNSNCHHARNCFQGKTVMQGNLETNSSSFLLAFFQLKSRFEVWFLFFLKLPIRGNHILPPCWEMHTTQDLYVPFSMINVQGS